MIELVFQKNTSEIIVGSRVDSRLYSGMKLEVDVGKSRKAVIIDQKRNEGLIWTVEVETEKRS